MFESLAFPPQVMFDIINLCNAQCPHCPSHAISSDSSFKKRQLPIALFKKCIDEIKSKNVEFIRITGDGEPLLHNELSEMIRYAKQAGIKKVNLTTNGSLLTDDRIRSLINAGLDVIDISLDALFEDTYRRVRKGLNFQTVHKNVTRLLEIRNPNQLKVIVSAIDGAGAQKSELEEFRNFWSSRVDAVAIRSLHTNKGFYGEREQPKGLDRWPCQHPFRRIVVDFQGNIKFCPVDWKKESTLGNLNNSTLTEVWSSQQWEHVRSCHRKGEFEKVPVCTKCTDWATTPWGKGWETLLKSVGTPTPEISLVMPIYNEEESLRKLVPVLRELVVNQSLEVILVNDGSTDGTTKILDEELSHQTNCLVLNLNGNQGQQKALFHGMKRARGKCIVTIDADLQYDLKSFNAVAKPILEEGYDIVSAVRIDRHDSTLTQFSSILGNIFLKWSLGSHFSDFGSCKGYSRTIVQKILDLGEQRFVCIPAASLLFSKKITEVPIDHFPRKFGKSKWSLLKRIHLALQIHSHLRRT